MDINVLPGTYANTLVVLFVSDAHCGQMSDQFNFPVQSAVVTLADGRTALQSTIVLPASQDINSLVQFEEALQRAANQACLPAMEHGLCAFDTEGEPILVQRVVYTSKGRIEKTFRTKFGDVTVSRHVYQTSEGGKTVVPMEERGRIVMDFTPGLAALVTSQYAEKTGASVERGLMESNQIKISDTLIREVAATMGKIALSKETYWGFKPEVDPGKVAHIGLGVDGALAPVLLEGEWKEVMVATITLYDKHGEALHVAYLAKSPQHGKERFIAAVNREVARYKSWYPDALWVGLSDGASQLREILLKHCGQLMLDYFHASEYLSAAYNVMRADLPEAKRKERVLAERKRLKSEPGAAKAQMEEMRAYLKRRGRVTEALKPVAAAATYFENNLDRMDYAEAVEEGLPIGSGVTEAACKMIVKARFCGCGMRWHNATLDQILALRVLRLSYGRWEAFWRRIERDGF